MHECLASIQLTRIQTVDNFVENCISVLEMGQKGELLECHFDESHILVIVLKDALSDVLVDLWVLEYDLFEVFLVELADGAVFECDN